MNSRTNIAITESLNELQQLELRVAMLRMMKEQPEIAQKELAAQLGVSERTIRRWQKVYRTNGISSVVSSEHIKPEKNAGSESDIQLPPGALQRFLQFVNALPRKGTLQEMSNRISTILVDLFSDVEYAACAINARCDLKAPDSYSPDLIAIHREKVQSEHFSVSQFKEEEVISGIRESLQATGLVINEENHPKYFVYQFDGAFLGVILLWRQSGQHPISDNTIGLINSIEPFLVVVLSDIVARYAYGSPVDTAFNDALENLSVRAKLSTREREALLHLLRGSSYEETANALNISRDTIKSRMRSVYIKTGTKDLTELFGKYFTPRLTPPEPPELPYQE